MTPPCPLCGRPLDPVTLPSMPPWLCPDDSRAWWPTELSPQAREALRPALRDYGVGEPAAMVALGLHFDSLSDVLPEEP